MIPREVLSFVGAQLEFRLMRFSLMPHGAKPVSSIMDHAARNLRLQGVVCGRGRNPTLRLWPALLK